MIASLAWSPKEPHEYLDYQVDFRERLSSGELIVEVDAVVTFGTIEVDRVQQANGHVLMWIGGGTKNQLARVLVTATTNAGRINQLDITLPIK